MIEPEKLREIIECLEESLNKLKNEPGGYHAIMARNNIEVAIQYLYRESREKRY